MITELNPALNELGRQIVLSMQNTLQQKGINATGNLSRSIKYQVVGSGDDLQLQISFDEYGDYIDSGRKGATRGGPRQSWAEKIIPWARAKGISPRQGISYKTMAFLIARKINRQGYKAKPWIDQSISSVLNQDLDQIFGPAVVEYISNSFPPELFKEKY